MFSCSDSLFLNSLSPVVTTVSTRAPDSVLPALRESSRDSCLLCSLYVIDGKTEAERAEGHAPVDEQLSVELGREQCA